MSNFTVATDQISFTDESNWLHRYIYVPIHKIPHFIRSAINSPVRIKYLGMDYTINKSVTQPSIMSYVIFTNTQQVLDQITYNFNLHPNLWKYDDKELMISPDDWFNFHTHLSCGALD